VCVSQLCKTIGEHSARFDQHVVLDGAYGVISPTLPKVRYNYQRFSYSHLSPPS
jgi:hypothetical protein